MPSEKTIQCFIVFLAVTIGWQVNGWRLNSKFDQERLLAALKLEDARLQNQVTELQWQSKTKRLDKQHFEELTNANKTVDALRADLRDKRLHFTANCKLPTTAENPATGGLVHAEARAELGEEDAGAILDTAAEGDNAIIALTACQDYINTIQPTIKIKL
jgi:prophage endopeptidase